MKAHYKFIFIVLILLLICLHRYLFSGKEGFYNSSDEANYQALKSRLKTTMSDYCQLSTFVRAQAIEMRKGLKSVSATLPEAKGKPINNNTQALMDSKPLGKSVDSWEDFDSVQDTDLMYSSVYKCTDPLASSRASCFRPNRSGMQFVSCDAYMKLPNWSPTATDSLALITNDLPERLTREVEWFQVIIKKLQDGLAAGANPQAGSNPVGVPPTPDQIAKASEEGFKSCSPEEAAYRRSQACTLTTPSAEIARVNALLDNAELQSAISKCKGMMAEMLKLQSDLEKLKNGTLYDWQKDGAKKSYGKFQGGDRTQALTYSMKQNQ